MDQCVAGRPNASLVLDTCARIARPPLIFVKCAMHPKQPTTTPTPFKRFDKAGVKAHTMCPPQQQEQERQRQQQKRQAKPLGQHSNVFCDGPRCAGATQGIVGHRYTCADCPSSVDLCDACYSSQTAHDASHSFKRFEKSGTLGYMMCPPQKTRPEHHSNVFCDGPMCRGANQCIAGPRYVCAHCPPYVDLCQRCYLSRDAHNPSHSFKRFDKAGTPAYVLCSPPSREEDSSSSSETDDRSHSLEDFTAGTVQPLQVTTISEPCLNYCIANNHTRSEDRAYWV